MIEHMLIDQMMMGVSMLRSEKLMNVVQQHIETVLERPEVKQELATVIDTCLTAELPVEIKRLTHEYLTGYHSKFRDAIIGHVTEWMTTHKDEVQAMAEAAALKAASDESVYNVVAAEQFRDSLSRMAGIAIDKAMSRRAKRDAKAKK